MFAFFRSAAVLILLSFMVFGCVSTQPVVESVPINPVEETPAVMLTVTVDQENLRSSPSGTRVGQAVLGESFELLERRMNWCRYEHPEQGMVWIWAPSVGIAQTSAMNILQILGSRGEFRSEDSLQAWLGTPTSERRVAPNVVEITYDNRVGDGTLYWGNQPFESCTIGVDRITGAALYVDYDLGRKETSPDELLSDLGLQDSRPTESNFDIVQYQRTFPGFHMVEFRRVQGDFTKYSGIHVDKLDPNAWRSQVVITNKHATEDEGMLFVILTLVNNSSQLAFSAPKAHIEIEDNGRSIGEWTVGPLNLRLQPGEEAEARYSIPVDVSSFNLMSVNMSAELVEMFTVPPESGVIP